MGKEVFLYIRLLHIFRKFLSPGTISCSTYLFSIENSQSWSVLLTFLLSSYYSYNLAYKHLWIASLSLHLQTLCIQSNSSSSTSPAVCSCPHRFSKFQSHSSFSLNNIALCRFLTGFMELWWWHFHFPFEDNKCTHNPSLGSFYCCCSSLIIKASVPKFVYVQIMIWKK